MVAEISRHRRRYHHVPALYSINQPPATLYSSSASSWGTLRDSSSSKELTSGVESSGLTLATRPNNGGRGTGPIAVSRTGTSLQASQHAPKRNEKSVIIALLGRKRGRPRKT
jgi:hypothetical protein